MLSLMTENTIDIFDNKFRRKGLLVVDGSYMGVTHGMLLPLFLNSYHMQKKTEFKIYMILKLSKKLDSCVDC